MNTCLVHFCLVDQSLLSALFLNGYQVSAISIPAFARPDNDLSILKQFNPRCFIFDISSWLGLGPSHVSSCSHSLDPSTKYSLFCQSLRMSVFDHLNPYERSLIIDNIFRCAVAFLTNNAIELLVFGGCPHSVADACLMAAAKTLNITAFFLQDKPIAPLSSFVYNSDYQLVDATSVRNALPGYPKMLESVHTNYQTNRSLILDTKSPAAEPTPWKKIYQTPDEPLSTRIAKLQVADQNKHLLRDSVNYMNQWNSRASNPLQLRERSSQAVTYYMHVEPEAAVNPFAGTETVFQYSAIIRLRDRLDERIPLLIKEHPAMFLCSYERPNVYKDYRPLHLLDTLAQLPNTYLVHTDHDPIDLIALTSCAAVLSGSVAHDYVMQRKPVLMHKSSHAFFGIGSYDIDEHYVVTPECIQDWCASIKANTDLEIIDSWLRPSVPGSPNAHLNMFRDLPSSKSRAENSISLAHSIHLLRNHIFS